MKKLIVMPIFVVLILASLFVLGSTHGTTRHWITLRAVSSTDDTGLDAAEAKWSGLPTGIIEIHAKSPLDDPIGALTFIFKLTDSADETANWCLYATKGVGSPAEFVAYGTCTAGLTQTGNTDEFYADTIVITVQNWYKTLSIKAGYQYDLGTGVVTGGGISALSLDSCEYTDWLMLMSKGTCLTMGAEFSNFY